MSGWNIGGGGEWQEWDLLAELVLKLRHPPMTPYYIPESALSAFYVLVDWVGPQDRGSRGP